MRQPTAASFVRSFDGYANRFIRLVTEEGAALWTDYAWQVLHAVARDHGVYCACTKGYHPDRKKGENREWLWDLTWFDATTTKQFVAPVAIIEHENSHHDDDFLADFWKVMVGYCPLRVMIGYTRSTEAAMKRRREHIHNAVSGMVFPDHTTDLIILKRYGPSPWECLVRQSSSSTFRDFNLESASR